MRSWSLNSSLRFAGVDTLSVCYPMEVRYEKMLGQLLVAMSQWPVSRTPPRTDPIQFRRPFSSFYLLSNWTHLGVSATFNMQSVLRDIMSSSSGSMLRGTMCQEMTRRKIFVACSQYIICQYSPIILIW